MNAPLRRQRGLAVMVVIGLFTLITAAVVSMTLAFAAQAQRTRADDDYVCAHGTSLPDRPRGAIRAVCR